MGKIKEYTNGELTIVWKPELCIHAKECIKELPSVYDPNERPWITPSNATTPELIDQVNKCPSGALTYFYNNDKNEAKTEHQSGDKTRIDIMINGPLIVKNNVEIHRPDGSIINKEKQAAFCRCGHSANKPFCDGAHKGSDFVG